MILLFLSFFLAPLPYIINWLKHFILSSKKIKILPKKITIPLHAVTAFGSSSKDKDLMESLALKLYEVKGIRLVAIATISEDKKNITLMKEIAGSNQRKTENLPLPPNLLDPIIEKKTPVKKTLVHTLFKKNGLVEFLKSILLWDLCDFILPLSTSKPQPILVFLGLHNPTLPHWKKIEFISKLFEILNFIILSSQALQKEREFQSLIFETKEKKLSYETLQKKVQEINDNLTKIQREQEKQIESARWMSLSQITVTLNHEINNPLTHILGISQLLQQKVSKNFPMDDEELEKNLNSISRQCSRIVDIIKSLRKISVPVIEKYLPEIEMVKLDISHKRLP